MVQFADRLQLRYFNADEPPAALSVPREVSEKAYSSRWKIMKKNFSSSSGTMMDNSRLLSFSIQNDNIVGSLLVRNLSFGKQVSLVASLDNWKTNNSITAFFSHSLQEGDVFNFEYSLDTSLPFKLHSLEFTIKYETVGQTFWNNNNSKNFIVSFDRVQNMRSKSISSSLKTQMKVLKLHSNFNIRKNMLVNDEEDLQFKLESENQDYILPLNSWESSLGRLRKSKSCDSLLSLSSVVSDSSSIQHHPPWATHKHDYSPPDSGIGLKKSMSHDNLMGISSDGHSLEFPLSYSFSQMELEKESRETPVPELSSEKCAQFSASPSKPIPTPNTRKSSTNSDLTTNHSPAFNYNSPSKIYGGTSPSQLSPIFLTFNLQNSLNSEKNYIPTSSRRVSYGSVSSPCSLSIPYVPNCF